MVVSQQLPLHLNPMALPYRPPPTPPPFFRRPSSTSSSSFLSSTTSFSEESSQESSSETDSEDDEETEGYYSSSGVSGDESRFIRRLDLSITGGGSGAGGPDGEARFPPFGSTSITRGGSNSARSNLKLSLAVLRARQSLASQSYEALAGALKALAAALPPVANLSAPSASTSGDNPLGVFVPILQRLAKDVKESLVGEEKGREFRRKLGKEDAKALIALRQRWSGSGKESAGKGKGKEVDGDWVPFVNEIVAKNPPPDFLTSSTYLTLTPALLSSLEALLLPSSLPRFSLSTLSLNDRDLLAWPALCQLEAVVAWYLSFVVSDAEEARARTQKVLEGVRSLDLSKNKLTTFPFYLTRLFPNLETLSLSHNAFPHLPPWITLFSSLRRLRTHGNRLVSSRKALKPLDGRISKKRREKVHPRGAGTRANVRDVLGQLGQQISDTPASHLCPSLSDELQSLFSISSQLVRTSLSTATDDSASSSDLDPLLPLHLRDVVLSSYTCASCLRFVLASTSLHVPPFSERIHHLDPGIAIPSRVPAAAPATPPLTGGGSSPPFVPPYAERPATIEQRILLALLARLDARPPPPPRRASIRRASSSTSLSSLASASTTSNGPPRRRPTRRERDWENGKAVLPTLVIGGDGEHGDGYRFCALCAAAHLGLEAELGEAGVEWECGCCVCAEERRIREGGPVEDAGREIEDDGEVRKSKATVMRWLRRKETIGREVVPPGGMRIA
ncbi:hypothetical protein JCM6882_008258 [Rhodosporidiobolus microsporus]